MVESVDDHFLTNLLTGEVVTAIKSARFYYAVFFSNELRYPLCKQAYNSA